MTTRIGLRGAAAVVIAVGLLLGWQQAVASPRATVAPNQVVRLSVDGWGGGGRESVGGAQVALLGAPSSGVETTAPGGARLRIHRVDAVPRPAPPVLLPSGYVVY